MNPILPAYSQLLLDIYRNAQELPVDEFQDAVLGVLKALLPFDSSMWGTATMRDDGIDIHSIHLHRTSQAMIEEYERIKHMDVAAERVASQPMATMSFNTDRDFPGEQLRDYREFLHKFRHENTLITSHINPATRFGQWITLWRHRPEHVCTANETEWFACLAPHLMQALAINRLVHLDHLAGDVAREVWCVAIADTRGVLYHADRRFRELVRADWPNAEDQRLPAELLERLFRQAQVTGVHTVVRQSIERGILYLKARSRADVDDLTEREMLVATLLASGLTHKQVAARLRRSPETIRSQTKSLFQKLGIHSAAMLPAKLTLRAELGKSHPIG